MANGLYLDKAHHYKATRETRRYTHTTATQNHNGDLTTSKTTLPVQIPAHGSYSSVWAGAEPIHMQPTMEFAPTE